MGFIIAAQTGQDHDALYKYNTDDNKWTQWLKYPSNLETSYHTVSFDNIGNKLYIHNSERNVITINLNNKTCNVKATAYDGAHTVSCCHNHKYYIFGGWDHNKCLEWNDDSNSFTELFGFEDFQQSFCRQSSVYLRRTKSVVIIGGIDKLLTRSSSIYSYNFISRQLAKLPAKLPQALTNTACIV